MSTFIQETLTFIVEAGVSVFDLAKLCLVFMFETARTLHEDAPRLEGLLAGLLSAFALKLRDKNIDLKVLSTPLKLVLDALSFANKQLTGLTGKALAMAKKPFVWLSGKGRGFYESLKGGLSSLKAKLTRKKD